MDEVGSRFDERVYVFDECYETVRDPQQLEWELNESSVGYIVEGGRPLASRHFLEFDLIALAREPESEQAFATDVPGLTLNDGEFESPFDGGFQLEYRYDFSNNWLAQVSYTGSLEWSDRLVGSSGGAIAFLEQSSKMSSWQANIAHRIESPYQIPWMPNETYSLVGVRGGDFRELFHNQFSVATENDLLGLQIGLLSEFLQSPKSFASLELTGGVFQNQASQTTAGGNVSGVVVSGGTTEQDRTSWGGTFALRYEYDFSPTWSLHAGYLLHWYAGVALAANNFENDLGIGMPVLEHDGNILFHGPSLGFTWIR